MNVDAFGAERKGAAWVHAEIKESIFGVIVAIHSCYNINNFQINCILVKGSLFEGFSVITVSVVMLFTFV